MGSGSVKPLRTQTRQPVDLRRMYPVPRTARPFTAMSRNDPGSCHRRATHIGQQRARKDNSRFDGSLHVRWSAGVCPAYGPTSSACLSFPSGRSTAPRDQSIDRRCDFHVTLFGCMLIPQRRSWRCVTEPGHRLADAGAGACCERSCVVSKIMESAVDAGIAACVGPHPPPDRDRRRRCRPLVCEEQVVAAQIELSDVALDFLADNRWKCESPRPGVGLRQLASGCPPTNTIDELTVIVDRPSRSTTSFTRNARHSPRRNPTRPARRTISR